VDEKRIEITFLGRIKGRRISVAEIQNKRMKEGSEGYEKSDDKDDHVVDWDGEVCSVF